MRIFALARWFVFTAVLLGTSATVSAQDRDRKTAPKPKTAEQEVRLVIKQWADAVRQRDMSALGRIFSDDLFITDNTGATRGKKEELDVLRPSPTTRTVKVENENVKVRTYPRSNVAVVNAIVRMVFRTNGRDTPVAMRYTSVWEKRSGRWQLTVLQTARLAQKQS